MNTKFEQACPPLGEQNSADGAGHRPKTFKHTETTAQRLRWTIACTAISAAAGMNILFWVGAVLMSFGWWVVGTLSVVLTLIVWLTLNRFRVLESALVWVGLPSCIFLFAEGGNLIVQASPFALLGLGAAVGWTLPAVGRAQTALQAAANEMVAKYDDGRDLDDSYFGSLRELQDRNTQHNRDVVNGMMGSGPLWYLESEAHKDNRLNRSN